MSDKSGYVFEIKEGEYADKIAIAYHIKQEQIFRDRNQLCVTVFEPDFKKIIKENLLINIRKLEHTGFCN